MHSPIVETQRQISPATVVAVAVVAALAAVPKVGAEGVVNLLTEFFYLLILAQLWNLLAGFAGVVSLGQHAFVGFGGYVGFALMLWAGVHPLLALPLAAVGGMALALAAAPLVFRLRGPHMAIGTWVLAEVLRLGASQLDQFGGNAGISLPAHIAHLLDGESITRDSVMYLITLLVCVVVHLGAFVMLRSRHGLALTAIRDNETAARSSGVSSTKVKWLVYVLVGAGTSLAGAIICLTKFRTSPAAAFDINWTSYAIFISVIGGVGTLEGPIVGAIAFILLRHFLSDLGAWYLIILGSIAVAVMMKMPQGLWGTFAARFDVHLFPVRRRCPVIGGATSIVSEPFQPSVQVGGPNGATR